MFDVTKEQEIVVKSCLPSVGHFVEVTVFALTTTVILSPSLESVGVVFAGDAVWILSLIHPRHFSSQLSGVERALFVGRADRADCWSRDWNFVAEI